jgi:hypothetical protein
MKIMLGIKNGITKSQPDARYAVAFDDTDNGDDSLINFAVTKDTNGLPAILEQPNCVCYFTISNVAFI